VERSDLGRIMAFTDGVMAVAITLLVLNLEVPRVPGGELDEALVDLLPSLIAYLLSFALVGRFWIIHHRFFETMRGYDGRVVTINLTFLALIVLIPFATDLFDRYTQEAAAAAVLGAVLGLAALAHWGMVVHSLREGFVKDERLSDTHPYGSLVALSFTGVFLLSVPVAFLSPTAAALLWSSTILLHYPLGRMSARSAKGS
jgi:uncharacterized membrane protein